MLRTTGLHILHIIQYSERKGDFISECLLKEVLNCKNLMSGYDLCENHKCVSLTERINSTWMG